MRVINLMELLIFSDHSLTVPRELIIREYLILLSYLNKCMSSVRSVHSAQLMLSCRQQIVLQSLLLRASWLFVNDFIYIV